MIQTIALVVLVIAGAAFVQTNMSAMQTQIPLTVPGMADVKLTYLNLMVAMGGMLLLLWVAGLLDAAVLRARLRRQTATIRIKDQEITRMKAATYDQQEPALVGRLDTLAQEIRSRLARIEDMMSGKLDRAWQISEVSAASSGRTVREEIAVHSER